MKRAALLLLLLVGCSDDTTAPRVYTTTESDGHYVVRLEVRECDGRLVVDFASLLIDSTVALQPSYVDTGKHTIDLEFRRGRE